MTIFQSRETKQIFLFLMWFEGIGGCIILFGGFAPFHWLDVFGGLFFIGVMAPSSYRMAAARVEIAQDRTVTVVNPRRTEVFTHEQIVRFSVTTNYFRVLRWGVLILRDGRQITLHSIESGTDKRSRQRVVDAVAEMNALLGIDVSKLGPSTDQ